MGGDAASLYDGPITDIPFDLVNAINEALVVFSWYENLPKDEQPPRHIWWSGDLLDKWFKDVQEQRDGRGKKTSSYDRADDVPMSSNELVDRSR
jgi:hypothetical protein